MGVQADGGGVGVGIFLFSLVWWESTKCEVRGARRREMVERKDRKEMKGEWLGLDWIVG